eukprot:s3069_g9.t1
MPLHTLTRVDSAVLFIGALRLENSLAAFDFLHPDAATLSQGALCPDRQLVVMDFAQAEFFLLLRSATCSDAFLSTSGLAAGLSTAESLSVVDAALLELLMLLHGIAYLDLFMLVMDISYPELPLFLRAPSWPESATLPCGMNCCELLLISLDFSSLGLFLLLRASSHPGMLPIAFNCASIGSLVPLRRHGCLESALLLMGPCKLGPVSLLPVLDNTFTGPPAPLRTLRRYGIIQCSLTLQNFWCPKDI